MGLIYQLKLFKLINPIFLHNFVGLQRVRKQDMGEVVILDADNNTVQTPFQDLESLPQDVVNFQDGYLFNYE